MPAKDVPAWVDAMFRAIDARDTRGFLEHLTPDARFRYGSAPALVGVEAIGSAVDALFDSIAGCRHVLRSSWKGPDTVVLEGEVTYLTRDEREVIVPFVDVLELAGTRVSDYRVYLDPRPLDAPPPPDP